MCHDEESDWYSTVVTYHPVPEVKIEQPRFQPLPETEEDDALRNSNLHQTLLGLKGPRLLQNIWNWTGMKVWARFWTIHQGHTMIV